MKQILVCCFCLLIVNRANSQLVPFFKYKGAYFDDSSNCVIIKSLNLKQNSDGFIYYKDSLIFMPDSVFKFSIIEILKDYLVITRVDEKDIYNSYIYLMAKRRVKLFNMKCNKWADLDFGGKYIIDINDKKRTIIVTSGKDDLEEISF